MNDWELGDEFKRILELEPLMAYKFRSAAIIDMRERGVKWADIAEIFGIGKERCMQIKKAEEKKKERPRYVGRRKKITITEALAKLKKSVSVALDEFMADIANSPIATKSSDDVRTYLSIRATNILERLHVREPKDLEGMTHARLLRLRGCGTRTANEIIQYARSGGVDI